MAIIEPRLETPATPEPLWRRLCWLAVYWAGGVAVLAIVALILRWIVG
ncbi:DUF2474 family protein [Novosphingobium sp. Gsoil 351]|nr:DUF2474 family protein [Novosphingobium sp. Gsoil 351]QGN55430.1 DUF2474 family protein [Novosphingobium sp. Gsoil 351]